MTPNGEPTTEAGRRLLEREAYNSRSFALITARDILAIEAEARATATPGLREAVERHIGRFSGRDFDRDHEELRSALSASGETE